MKKYVVVLEILALLLLSSCLTTKSTIGTQQTKNLKIAVISDLNSSYGSVTYNNEVATTLLELAQIKPAFILCAGDMVAGQKQSLSEDNIRAMWQGFDSTVLQPIKKMLIPFGFTLGNHDASPTYKLDRSIASQFWQENVQATNLHFIDSSHYPFYYSFLQNNVYVLSWDAAGARVPAEVYTWMNKQLNSSVAKAAALRIVLGHLPLYPIVAAKNKPGEVNAAADSSLAFFKDNRVDLYISGHQHAFYPAKKEGLSLLNVGCIGDGERVIMGDSVARKAYTIIEVPAKHPKRFRYKTYNPLNHQPIEAAWLPATVTGFNGRVEKDDR